jgi:PAS domain S-box-containing protein
MQTNDSTSDELGNLRHTMRDLVALSTLPTVWANYNPRDIAESLADVLIKTLGLDLIYIRLRNQSGGEVIEVVRSRHQPDANVQAQKVGQALSPVLEVGAHDTPFIPDPFGPEMLRTAVIRLGYSGDCGVLVAASQRSDFPTEDERLLLGVGANQMTIIIQQKQAERLLQKEQEWLSVTLASIGDGVIATDIGGCVTFLNPVAESLTGWTLAEAIGQPLELVFRIVNEHTRQSVENPAVKALQEGVIVGLANHTFLIAKDGTERPIDDSAAPIRDDDGNVVGVVLVFRDVTERRQAEADQEAAHTQIVSILESLAEAFVAVDSDWRFTYINTKAEQIYRMQREVLLGKNLWEIFPEALGTVFEREYRRSMSERVPLRVESSFDRLGGWYEVNIYPVRDGGLAFYFQNVTKRKQAEEILSERAQLSTLRAEVSAYLASRKPLRTVLRHCAEVLVGRLDMALARVWILDEAEQVLELQASAGLYTHLDGPRRRVEVGQFEIGRIAKNCQSYVTNTVLIDLNISDPAWVKREGLVAFAGYPLAIEGHVVGVLAMFSRSQLSKAVQQDLVPLSDGIAQFIERKRTEENLRENEQRFRTLVEQVKDYAIFMMDPKGRATSWNEGVKRVLGFEESEFVGQNIVPLIFTPEDVQSGLAEEEMEQAVTTGRAGDDRWMMKKDGTRFFATGVTTALYGENGKLLGFTKVMRDQTVHRRLEEALQKSEERLRFIMDSMPQKIFTAKPNGDRNYLNPQWIEFTGLPLEVIKDWGWTKCIHPDDKEKIVRAWQKSLNTSESFQFEYRLRRADGEYRWHISRAKAIRDAEDQIAMWIGSSTDIHALKEAEMALARLTAESERQRRLYETIFSSTLDLVYVFDLNHRFTYANKALLAMWGRTLDESIGKNCLELGYPDWHAAMHDREIEQVKATKQPIRGEVPFTGPLGRRIYDYIFVPVIGASGEIEAVAGTTRDITEQKQLENHLRQLAAELSTADRRKDEFLATLAHELRNPLSPILTGLELIRMIGDDRAMMEEVCTRMEGQVKQLVRLVDDLLDVSRITTGKVILRRERVELALVVQGAVDATRSLIEESGHQLTVTLPPQPIFLEADPARLTQILSNLLTNAARYTMDRGHIWLTVQRQGSDVVVTVKDTGIGIPADMLEHIFEMFSQVDRSLERSQSGLGIGLTLVKKMVEMHGGVVEARSNGPGEGSEFAVRLPIVTKKKIQEQLMNDESITVSGSKLRILVVDDNRDSAEMLSMVLKTLGNEVCTAHDGLEAIDIAAEYQPHIVLMDIGMPKLNGYEAARRIREQPWGKHMVLIALTGWGQKEDKQRTKEAGFDYHLVKPVEPATLRKLLADHQPNSA